MSTLPKFPDNYNHSKIKRCITTNKQHYYDNPHHPCNFPVGNFFTDHFDCFPSIITDSRTYSYNVIDYLRKNGTLVSENVSVMSFSTRINLSSMNDGDGLLASDHSKKCYTDNNRCVFIYKDSLVVCEQVIYNRDEKNSILFTIQLFHKPGTNHCLEDFGEFLIDKKYDSIINTVFRDDSGMIIFEPFEATIPKDFDICKHYSPNFTDVHNNIVNSLDTHKSGLYLFHGEAGTGKTTYIKYLSSVIKKEMIYIPISFVETLVDPAFLPSLLRKKNSVLIIEDAEKALLKRDPGDSYSSSLVSTILNITDGIMGDIFNISIIASYNSERSFIDSALLRKGRLRAEYKFDKLSVEQSKQLVKENNIQCDVTEPMTLAEIFNAETQNNLTTSDLIQEKRMGFF